MDGWGGAILFCGRAPAEKVCPASRHVTTAAPAKSPRRSRCQGHSIDKQPPILLKSMDTLILDFRDAYEQRDGYKVAACLSPNLSKFNPPPWHMFAGSLSSPLALKARFLRPFQGANFVALHRDDEAEPWSDVLSAYWSALAEMLAAEHGHQGRVKGDWTKAYSSWKAMADKIIRAFQSSIFPF